MNNYSTRYEATVVVGILVLLLALILAAAMDDYKDAKDEERLYCSMVQQYRGTGGQYGWPDYKGIYDEVCMQMVKQLRATP